MWGRTHHGCISSEFNDDELAFLRHVRFGELPLRPRPEELVPLVETDARRDRPDVDPDPQGINRNVA